jgi:ribosomal protein S5
MSSSKRTYKAKSEWSERVVSIQRVTKVVKGGKKNEFPRGNRCWKRAR